MAPALRLARTTSLGAWTDLWTLGPGSRVERRGDTLSVTTPANPGFRWGNLVDAGAGAWFGAFEEGRLVADLGIFARSGVGRFQAVETHPDARGRGIASAMVAHAGRFAVDRLRASRLVILADPAEDAIRLYRRRGFEELEQLVGVSTPDAVRAGLADAAPEAERKGVPHDRSPLG